MTCELFRASQSHPVKNFRMEGVLRNEPGRLLVDGVKGAAINRDPVLRRRGLRRARIL